MAGWLVEQPGEGRARPPGRGDRDPDTTTTTGPATTVPPTTIEPGPNRNDAPSDTVTPADTAPTATAPTVAPVAPAPPPTTLLPCVYDHYGNRNPGPCIDPDGTMHSG